MAKEKHRYLDDENKKVSVFYYEIIGCIFILLSVISIGKLGKVGIILVNLVKVLFGDWYIIFFLFTTFYGIYSLFMHDKFNYKNTRFIGFVFFYIVIIIFSHYTLYDFLIENSESYFTGLFDIYKNFLNGTYQGILGGGVIGGILFHLIYYFLGSFGIILFSLCLIVLGISLIINKPVIDIFRNIFQKGQSFTKLFRNFNNFFKYDINFNSSPIIKKYTMRILDKKEIKFDETEEKDKRRALYELFCNKDIKINNGQITYHYITYKIELRYTFDIDILLKEIKDKFITSSFFYVLDKNILLLQLPLDNKYNLYLYNLIKIYNIDMNDKNYNIHLGVDYKNNLVTIKDDKTLDLLIICENKDNYQNFVYYILLYKLIRKEITIDNILIFDETCSFNSLKTYQDANEFFDIIQSKLDAKKNNPNNNLDHDIIIINYGDTQSSIIENKIIYYKDITKKYNFLFVLVSIENTLISEKLYRLFKNKLIFKTYSSKMKIYDNDIFSLSEDLDYQSDCLYVTSEDERRITTVRVTESEITKAFKN